MYLNISPKWIIGCVLIFAACSKAPERPTIGATSAPKAAEQLPEVVVKNDPAPVEPGITTNTEELPLGLVASAGSHTRFLDAAALSVYYSNIFSKQAYGYQHCKSARPLDYTDCTQTIFTLSERPMMGNFELALQGSQRRKQNVAQLESMTLNYMRSLRAALARECGALVERELPKVGTNLIAENVLIKGADPKAGDLDEFFRTILGVKGSGMKVDIQSDQYVAAFKAIVNATTDKALARKQAYLGLCIALSMNPQIIIY